MDSDTFLTRHSADFNQETVAALTEARNISDGLIQTKSFANVDELMKDLLNGVDK